MGALVPTARTALLHHIGHNILTNWYSHGYRFIGQTGVSNYWLVNSTIDSLTLSLGVNVSTLSLILMSVSPRPPKYEDC